MRRVVEILKTDLRGVIEYNTCAFPFLDDSHQGTRVEEMLLVR